jgi:STE24 endopeptidase
VKAYVTPLYIGSWLGPACTFLTYACLFRWAVGPLYVLAGRWAGRLAGRFAFLRRLPGTRAVLAAMDRIWRGPGWGQAVLFTLLFFSLDELTAVPFGIYFGYLHEKAFGLSNLTAWGFARETLKSNFFGLTALSMLSLGMYGVARRFRWWWLILGAVSGLALVGSQAVDPYRSQVTYDDKPLPPGHLRTSLEAMLQRAGIQFGDIYVENTSRLSNRVDVSCSGNGPTARVVLADRAVELLPEREILVAVAHEAGHVHESNPWPLPAAAGALLLLLFSLDRLFKKVAQKGWFGIREFADIRTLPLISLAFFAVQLFIAPISTAYSRYREREADRFALEVTHDPEAFESLLIHITRINKMDPDPPRWAVWRAGGHPPMRERIEWVEAWKNAASKGP